LGEPLVYITKAIAFSIDMGDVREFVSRVFGPDDPYAGELTNSTGNSIVTDPDLCGPLAYSTPPWNEMVIYELMRVCVSALN
jgi:hypothetical protein